MPSLDANKGSSVNASGTKIAAAVALGSGKLDTTKAVNDAHTFVSHGNQKINVKTAIAMGLLARNASDTLVELNPVQPATRTNS
jgi:hypothetical protein